MVESPSQLASFKLEANGIIELLAQNLYPNHDLFLRELVQNALDSIIRRRAQDEPGQYHPYIRVISDPVANQIEVQDNGAGFSAHDIEHYLQELGRSYTHELRTHIIGTDRERVETLIGQFGISLLSAFLVADRMTVTSRAKEQESIRWETDGTNQYSLQPADRDDVGTSVRLKIRNDQRQYLEIDRLKWIIRTYLDFLGVPVYLNQEHEPTNSVTAPWRRTYPSVKDRTEAYAEYWDRKYLSESSLHVFALDEAYEWDDPSQAGGKGRGKITGVLGVIDRRSLDQSESGSVDLYRRSVLITLRHRELLPSWARFIQGVIECDDLIPNAARDAILSNTTFSAARTALGHSIARELELLATSDRPRFRDIARLHGQHIIELSIQPDYESFFRSVADVVPLESDLGPMTMAEYAQSAPVRTDGSRVVYFITKSSSANQFILLASARGMRVFNCSNPNGEKFLQRYTELWPERVHLTRLDAAQQATIFESLTHDDRERFAELQAAYSFIFPDGRCVARVSRFQPSDIPAVLTGDASSSVRAEMQSVAANAVLPESIRDLVQEFLNENRSSPLVLQLNAENSIIQNLARFPTLRDEVARYALLSLYNNACMLMQPLRVHDAQAIYMQNNQLIDRFLSISASRVQLERTLNARQTELDELSQRLVDTRTIRDEYVSCFVALPFRDKRATEIFEGLKNVLEDSPWFWRVVRADDSVERPGLWENLKEKLLRAHCFVAILAGDLNPNVMIEIGRMEALDRPMLLLRAAGAPDLPADLHGRLYAELHESGAGLLSEIRDVIGRHDALLNLRGERFLSEAVLKRYVKLDGQLSKEISRRYHTWHSFIESDSDEVARIVSLSPMLVDAIKATLVDAMRRPDPGGGH